VNPAHLFLGTALDNNRDAVAKGRNFKGQAKSEMMKKCARRGDENGARRYPERVREGVRRYYLANPGVRQGRKTSTTILDEVKVSEILICLRDKTATRMELANRYGVSGGAIDSIRRRLNWRHVMPELVL
jgi:hypothetical protein